MGKSRETVILWSRRVARLVVAAVFIYAGWLKASDPGAFIRDIWNYHLIPEGAAYWIATYLPYVEIVTALALLLGNQRRGARLILGALLIVFLVALVSAWLRGLDISCGCFGASDVATNYPLAIARDLLLLACVWWSVAPVVSTSQMQRAS